MATTAGKSYDYNAICDVCGWKLKSGVLRKRWDGYMVCEKDWEPRHSLDFYRTKNDVHKLPFTRPDANNELTWSPALGGGTWTTTGIVSLSGRYVRSVVGSNIIYNYQITVTLVNSASSVAATDAKITLPVASAGDFGGVVLSLNGGFLCTFKVSGTENFTRDVTFPIQTKDFARGIILSGTYNGLT